MFADRPWPMRMPAINKHRELVRQMHGQAAGAPLLAVSASAPPLWAGRKKRPANTRAGSSRAPSIAMNRILRMFEERLKIVGELELATSFRFGGTPFDLAEEGLTLYCKEVLPVVQSWKAEAQTKVAAE
jgi:hypothetical protein